MRKHPNIYRPLSPGTPSLEFWFFVLFFPLNWAVKLENFRLNLRMNSLVVPYWAQKRARVAKKRPILCNMTVWFSSGSFFKRIISVSTERVKILPQLHHIDMSWITAARHKRTYTPPKRTQKIDKMQPNLEFSLELPRGPSRGGPGSPGNSREL